MSKQLQIIPLGTTRLLMNQTIRYVTQLTLITSEAELQTAGLHVFLKFKNSRKKPFTKILHEFQMRSRVILEHVMNVDLFVVNVAVQLWTK